MKIQLSDHFTYNRILRFVFPSIAMMVFTSIYGIVDGFFVSNFVGKTSFAAINLIMPFIMLMSAVGFVLGTGGSALVGKTLGEQKPDLANRYFSMIVYAGIILGAVVSGIGVLFMRPMAVFFGAEGQLLHDCVLYGNLCMISMTFFTLQSMFQNLFVTAEKPNFGFYVTVVAGVANMVLDLLFIPIFHWGLAGAAMATVISETLGGIIPLIYFARKNTSLLRLTRTSFYASAFGKTCVNGLSEMVSTLSVSFVSMLFNFQLMRFAGEDGVAAYGVMMYVNFIYMAIFFGYAMGIAPVISYHFGAQNHDELKNLFTKSVKLITISGVSLTALALALTVPLCKLFVGYDTGLYELTKHGYMILAFSFLLFGFNIFGSDFFTALNNGVVSAILSFSRIFIFRASAVLILPIILGLDGVWISAIVSEVLAMILTVIVLIAKKEQYHYL